LNKSYSENTFFIEIELKNPKAELINLSTEIKFLPGVGPKRAELLGKELGLTSYKDLLEFYPYKYIDRSRIMNIREINSTHSHIQLKGKITSFKMAGSQRSKRLVAIFADSTGSVELVWFKGIQWVQKNYSVGVEYLLFGKPSVFSGKINIAHPEIEMAGKAESKGSVGLQAQYSGTEKLKNNFITSKTIAKIVDTLIQKVDQQIADPIPEYIRKEQNLLSRNQALKQIHQPENNTLLHKAIHRIKFEELFYLQLSVLRLKVGRNQRFSGHVFSQVGTYLNTFFEKNLPFELTNAQKRVVKEIRADLKSGLQMNRLLQGDVGSGKTLVALMNMLIALDNGFQTCLMAPTENSGSAAL
jgi:ATP-dependent DNA helicase RecG